MKKRTITAMLAASLTLASFVARAGDVQPITQGKWSDSAITFTKGGMSCTLNAVFHIRSTGDDNYVLAIDNKSAACHGSYLGKKIAQGLWNLASPFLNNGMKVQLDKGNLSSHQEVFGHLDGNSIVIDNAIQFTGGLKALGGVSVSGDTTFTHTVKKASF